MIRVIVVFSVAVVAFISTLNNSFIFDDFDQTINNIVVISGSLYDVLVSYRPMRTLSYWIDYRIFVSDPYGFRLMNIFYHALTSLSVYWVLLLLGMRKNASFFAALFFAIHPIHCDAVSYISGRRDVLTALFFVLSLGFFIKFYQIINSPQPSLIKREGVIGQFFLNRKTFLAISIVCMLLSFLSKETGATIPLVWLLYIYYVEGNALFKKPWFYAIAMIVLTIFSMFGIYAVQQGGSSFIKPGSITFHGDNWVTHYLTALTLPIYYLRQTIFPLYLRIDNINYPLMLTLNLKVVFSLIGTLSYITTAFLLIRKTGDKRVFGFFMLFFMLTLIPMLQIVPLHEIAAEHYLYLPSVAFCAIVGLVADNYFKRLKNRQPKEGFAILIFSIICLFSIFLLCRTVTRNIEMKNFATILHAEERWGELSYRGYYTLAAEYMSYGFPEKAAAYLEKSISTGYYDSNTYANKIQIKLRQGDVSGAIKEFEQLPQKIEQTNRMRFDAAAAYFIKGDCLKVNYLVNVTSRYYVADVKELLYLRTCATDLTMSIVAECVADERKLVCSSKKFAESGQFLSALLMINQALKKEQSKENLLLKAQILERLGKLRVGAIEVYKTLLREYQLSDDELLHINHTLGLLYIKTDVTKAIFHFTEERRLLEKKSLKIPLFLEKTIDLLARYSNDVLNEKNFFRLDI